MDKFYVIPIQCKFALKITDMNESMIDRNLNVISKFHELALLCVYWKISIFFQFSPVSHTMYVNMFHNEAVIIGKFKNVLQI